MWTGSADFWSIIPPDWIIQRLTGDPNPGELVAPVWALEKKKTLELIRTC